MSTGMIKNLSACTLAGVAPGRTINFVPLLHAVSDAARTVVDKIADARFIGFESSLSMAAYVARDEIFRPPGFLCIKLVRFANPDSHACARSGNVTKFANAAKWPKIGDTPCRR